MSATHCWGNRYYRCCQLSHKGQARKEAHADWLYKPANTYGRDLDIVFESNMKELSILRLRGDVPDYSPKLVKLIDAAAVAADKAGTTD